jgi:hypothetical protein
MTLETGRGKITPKRANPKRFKKSSVVAKRNRPVGPGNVLHKLEITDRHDQTALVGVDEQVAFKAMRASSSSVALVKIFCGVGNGFYFFGPSSLIYFVCCRSAARSLSPTVPMTRKLSSTTGRYSR